MSYKVAVVGATGNVGREILQILDDLGSILVKRALNGFGAGCTTGRHHGVFFLGFGLWKRRQNPEGRFGG